MSSTVNIDPRTDKAGAIAVAAGSAIWGLFWIPLRYLDDAGITGLWAVAVVLAAALIPSIIVAHFRGESRSFRNIDCWLVGVALGLATVLYFAGVLYSDVIRVIFLFYLLPLWTTLSARIIYGEPIRREQLVVIIAAITGVWLLLGGGTNLPVPQNIGDWCGIGAGFCWGVSLSLLRGREQTPPFASTAATMATGLLMAIVAATVMYYLPPSTSENVLIRDQPLSLGTIAVGLAFGMAVLFPAMLGQIWGARRIPAPTAALLTMTEIIVATVSAGWLIGTDLPPISILGGVIIIMAVFLDLHAQRKKS